MNERVFFGFRCRFFTCLSAILLLSCAFTQNTTNSQNTTKSQNTAKSIEQLYQESQRTLATARANQFKGVPSQEHWRDLIASSKAILTLDPSHPEANAWIAEAYETLGLQTQAWRSWQQTWLETNDITALKKAMVLGHQLAEASLAKNLVDAAEKYYLAMLELDSSDIRIYKGLARIAGGKGLHDAEEHYWRAVLKLEPNDQEALATLSILTQAVSVTENESVTASTVTLEERYLAEAVAAYREGLGLYEAQQAYKARLLFIEAVELDDSFKEAWVWVGRTRFEQKSYVLAALAFEKALELDPNDGDVRARLLQARAKQ